MDNNNNSMGGEGGAARQRGVLLLLLCIADLRSRVARARAALPQGRPGRGVDGLASGYAGVVVVVWPRRRACRVARAGSAGARAWCRRAVAGHACEGGNGARMGGWCARAQRGHIGHAEVGA